MAILFVAMDTEEVSIHVLLKTTNYTVCVKQHVNDETTSIASIPYLGGCIPLASTQNKDMGCYRNCLRGYVADSFFIQFDQVLS